MFRITGDPSSGSLVQCLTICCHNTDHVRVNGHDRTIFVILAKHCTRLPDDGSSLIRNMLKHFFKYFVILIVSSVYIFVH